MKNKYCPVPESEHGEDGKVKTSVGEMPCKYCEALERQREEFEESTRNWNPIRNYEGYIEVDKKGMRKIMQDSFYIHNGAYYCTEHNEKNCLICLT